MKTKNILNALLAFCVGCCLSATTSCSSDDDPFFTASGNDAPRILNTDLPEGSGSDPAVIKTIEYYLDSLQHVETTTVADEFTLAE